MLRNCRKNLLGGLTFSRVLIAGAAGLDPALCIAVPVGHGLGQVRQLVGLNEGASRKADERLKRENAHEGTHPAPSRGIGERVQVDQRNEGRNKGRKRQDDTSKRHQKANFN